MTDRARFHLSAAACVAIAVALPHVLAAQQPAGLPAQAQLVARMRGLLDSLAAADEFSGVVLLARGAEPVFQRAYGMADREARRPPDLETRFNLGSINKFITRIAIEQLAGRGALSLSVTRAEVHSPSLAFSGHAPR